MIDYTGQLEPIVSKSATGTASYRPTLYALLKAAQNRPDTHPYDGATTEQWFAFDGKTHRRVLNKIGQPFPPYASKQQLTEALKSQAEGAVLLRAPAGTIWADDPIPAGGTRGHAAPLRDVPHADGQEHGRLRARRPRRQVRLRPAERPERDDGLLVDGREGVQGDHELARRRAVA